MAFHHQMTEIQHQLRSLGHLAQVPDEINNLELNESYMDSDSDKITTKIEYDFIRAHFKKIESAEAILILNYPKKGIKGYIGGNTFLEMGYAFGLGKKIYTLFGIPQMDYYTEMVAMQPVILNGDLKMLSSN